MPLSRPGDRVILDEIRDCLAAGFSIAVADEHGAMTEILEHQLKLTEDREKWRPLRQAIEDLRDLAPVLRDRLDATVRARYDARLSPETDKFSRTTRFSLDTLSLVSEEEVQEEIAIGNAARRLREVTGDEFFALNARLAAVLGRDNLAEEQSPAHPRLFARALLDVLAQSGSDPAARLAAFAACGPAMLHALPAAYKAANSLLVKRGIQPDLRRSYGAPQQVPGVRASAQGVPHPPTVSGTPAGAAAQPSPGQGLFDRLLANATSAPASVPEGLVTLLVRPELIEALRKLEAHLEADPRALEALPNAASHGEAALPAHSPDVVRRAREEMAAALTPGDVLVADLVAAVFGRLFIDSEVSDAAKVQLGRLQLPVFKAVMADRRFFTDPAHPIRGLIDAIAELGAAGEAFPVDGKLPEQWLSEVTQGLLDVENLDSGDFEAARDRLVALAARHHEAVVDNDAIVKTVRQEEAEISAVEDASLEVAHRIAASYCPQAAAVFAYRAWRPVLLHDHRTVGRESAQWKADIETLDDLLWTLAPRATATERERLAALLPSVRYRMWQGLIRAQLTTEEIESLLDELDHIHGELQRAPLAAAQGELTATVALGPTVTEDTTATLHISSESMRDEGLVRGAWFQFTEDDGTARRARLAWVSPVQGACVFKDIAHGRSFAISLADLRTQREQGRAVSVDGPGVALSSIEGALRDVARERAAAPTS